MQTGCAPKAISQTSTVPPLITHTVPSVAGVIVLHGRKGARSCRRRGYWSLRRNQIVRVVAPRVAVAALSTGAVGVLSIWTPVIPNRVFEQFRSPIIVAWFVINQTSLLHVLNPRMSNVRNIQPSTSAHRNHRTLTTGHISRWHRPSSTRRSSSSSESACLIWAAWRPPPPPSPLSLSPNLARCTAGHRSRPSHRNIHR